MNDVMNTTNNEIINIEKDIYNYYINIINDLVSQYEVYQHDLHPNISENIVILFQTLSLAKTADSETSLELIKASKSQSLITARELYVRLLDIYYKRIKLLRKNNRLYKQSAVVWGNTEIHFKNYADPKFRSVRKEYKKVRKKYRFVLKEQGEDEFLLDDSSLSDLVKVYDNTKELLDQYEEYVPKIIGSGYNGSLGNRFIKAAYWLISAALAIIALILFLISNNIIKF